MDNAINTTTSARNMKMKLSSYNNPHSTSQEIKNVKTGQDVVLGRKQDYGTKSARNSTRYRH
jgi:hypothetical protein